MSTTPEALAAEAKRLAEDYGCACADYRRALDRGQATSERLADCKRVQADLHAAIDALAAAARQEQPPAGYVTAVEEGRVLMLPRASLDTSTLVPLYAGARQEQRKPLSDEQIARACLTPHVTDLLRRIVREVERAHGIEGAAKDAAP